MPKSRRNKVVSLTQTKKKNSASAKKTLLEKIRASADAATHIYIIQVANMRNAVLKNLRASLKESSNTSFSFGHNRVVAKALGVDTESEHRRGLQALSADIKGDVGLCFSSLAPAELKSKFQDQIHTDFARNGVIATETFTLPAGPVVRRIHPIDVSSIDSETRALPGMLPPNPDADLVAPFPNNMETQLRALGMPTLLKGGVITLMRDYTVCSRGDTLSTNQAQLLKHFNIMMAKFDVRILGHWTEENGYERLDEYRSDGGENRDEGADDDDENDDDAEMDE